MLDKTRMRPLRLLAVLTFAAGASLWGCDGADFKPGSGIVSGYVYLRGSEDHCGSEVRLGGKSTATDSTGNYVFYDVPDGTWTVYAQHFHYYPQAETLTVRRGCPTEPVPDIHLSPANIGHAYLEGLDTHSGICIYLDDDRPVSFTGPDGWYVMPPMADGLHDLRFEFPKFETVEKPVAVVGGWAVPPLGVTVVRSPGSPVIVELNDVSKPKSNPSRTRATVALSAFTQEGVEVLAEEYAMDRDWAKYGCDGTYHLVLVGLEAGRQYDIVLSVPRYFYLQFRDTGPGAVPDTLVIENLVPGAEAGVRTERIDLLSYSSDKIIVVLSSEFTEAERVEIIHSMGCIIIDSIWASSYNAPMYIIDIPDDRTELEMVRLFGEMAETLYATLGTVGGFDPPGPHALQKEPPTDAGRYFFPERLFR